MSAVEARTHERLRASARELLEANWRSGRNRAGHGDYGFTCPATPRYRHQWYWDSCFHAIVWSHFDPARARQELWTLLNAGRADGFVPHTAFWDAPARWRRAPFYATARFTGDLATESIQTPLIAVAWERVAAACEDGSHFIHAGLPRLKAHYEWLAHNRDPDRDGLLSIILPDESGLDDSPKYDALLGWRAHWKPGYLALVARARRAGYRADAIARTSDLHVEDVLVNVAYVLGLEALARMRGENGDGPWTRRARVTTQALLARSHDEQSGLFHDLAGRSEQPLQVSTWSSLAPLALGGIPDQLRRRIVESHLLHPRRYLAAAGIPSVSMEEPAFNPRFDLWRTWRGPSWMATAWFLVPAMRELGYVAEAGRVVDSLADAVMAGGWREYYNPLTGRGEGAKGFAMSTLLVDLLEPAEVRSGRQPPIDTPGHSHQGRRDSP